MTEYNRKTIEYIGLTQTEIIRDVEKELKDKLKSRYHQLYPAQIRYILKELINDSVIEVKTKLRKNKKPKITYILNTLVAGVLSHDVVRMFSNPSEEIPLHLIKFTYDILSPYRKSRPITEKQLHALGDINLKMTENDILSSQSVKYIFEKENLMEFLNIILSKPEEALSYFEKTFPSKTSQQDQKEISI